MELHGDIIGFITHISSLSIYIYICIIHPSEIGLMFTIKSHGKSPFI